MTVTVVSVRVKSGKIQEFIEASGKNHKASVAEPGNRRFDFIQSEEDPHEFLIYEAYDTKEQAASHKATQHYAEWRDSVADMMERPRSGSSYMGVFPACFS